MKLLSYSKDGITSCGVFIGNEIIDIPSNFKGPNAPKTLVDVLRQGTGDLDKLTELSKTSASRISINSVKLLAPVPKPDKVIALAGNYSEHIKEAGLSLGLSDSPRQTTVPRPFLMPPSVVIGDGDIIAWPAYSEQIDYELELAVVIGKTAKCVTIKDAPNYIAGYTIANDVSARSVTFKTNRAVRPWDEFYDWLNGKWSDGFLPMGPYLVTADEIENVQNLDMQLTVNGKVRQRANTSQMIYSVTDIVSFVSHLVTLEPGDVIATGTPSGVAMATGQFLEAGDIIECTIEKLGSLKNTLGPKPKQFYQPLTG
ncbi:MAG: fumarylacetoacetate hydrolase family protein [Phycisphaerales bacterium]|jgi:2-keto-4-pentenoate hydratase/2-oxohepta-3-ene-1,7-dioic acid hydratase in catechol pathway